MAYLFIFVNKDRVHYRAGIAAVHVYTRVRTCLPPCFMLYKLMKYWHARQKTNHVNPETVWQTHSCHTLMTVEKKLMLKIVCLAWKFMRLHVAISFEKRLYPPTAQIKHKWVLMWTDSVQRERSLMMSWWRWTVSVLVFVMLILQLCKFELIV